MMQLKLPRMRTVDDILARAIPEPNSGCWLWERGIQTAGYGMTYAGGNRYKLAHRAAYEIAIGPIPAGFFVCHTCDNPCCVNPDHLFAGSHDDNVADKVRKGRQAKGAALAATLNTARGERHGMAKLSERQVTEIRASSLPQKTLAAQYGVAPGTIHRVKARKGWLHTQGLVKAG